VLEGFKMIPKKIIISVVNYNQLKFLKPMFNSLKKTTYKNYSVVFVDNSHDGSIEFVKKNYPSVTVIDPNANTGFAGGNNIAICSGAADYYLLLDCDTKIIDPEWIYKLVRVLEDDPNGGIAGALGVPMHLESSFDNNKLKEIIDEPIKVNMVSGSLMMIKSEVIEKIGLLDEDFFIYWEETDYQYNALTKGYNIWWVNFPYYHHSGSSTNLREQTKSKSDKAWVDEENKKKANGFYWYYRNEIMFSLINYGFFYLMKDMVRIAIRTAYHSFIKGNRFKRESIVKALKDIKTNWKTIMRKRKDRQNERIVSDSDIAKLKQGKRIVSHRINEYYKKLEADLMKEKKLDRTFYH
jgi:GT2 family glycosyltransferase